MGLDMPSTCVFHSRSSSIVIPSSFACLTCLTDMFPTKISSSSSSDCFSLMNIRWVLDGLATRPLEAMNFRTLLASSSSFAFSLAIDFSLILVLVSSAYVIALECLNQSWYRRGKSMHYPESPKVTTHISK